MVLTSILGSEDEPGSGLFGSTLCGSLHDDVMPQSRCEKSLQDSL